MELSKAGRESKGMGNGKQRQTGTSPAMPTLQRVHRSVQSGPSQPLCQVAASLNCRVQQPIQLPPQKLKLQLSTLHFIPLTYNPLVPVCLTT